MPYAIFKKPFDYDHRPRKAVCQHIKASDVPQSWPEKIIAAAVAAGCADRVEMTAEDILKVKGVKR